MPMCILLAISDDAIEPFLEGTPSSATARWCISRAPCVVDGRPRPPPPDDLRPRPLRSRDLPGDALRHRTWRRRDSPMSSPVSAILHGPSTRAQTPLSRALRPRGNFTTILWAKAMEDFEERLGLPREIFSLPISTDRRNSLAAGRDALTGSLARGDRGTIDRDLEASR